MMRVLTRQIAAAGSSSLTCSIPSVKSLMLTGYDMLRPPPVKRSALASTVVCCFESPWHRVEAKAITSRSPHKHMEVSINGGLQKGWFIVENPIKMDDPYLRKPPYQSRDQLLSLI